MLAMGFPPCLSRKQYFDVAQILGHVAFPLCLSRKRLSHGLGVQMRWAFPPACRRKGRLTDLVRACDGLSPQPDEEKALRGPAPMWGHAVYRLWAITRGAECFCRLAAPKSTQIAFTTNSPAGAKYREKVRASAAEWLQERARASYSASEDVVRNSSETICGGVDLFHRK